MPCSQETQIRARVALARHWKLKHSQKGCWSQNYREIHRSLHFLQNVHHGTHSDNIKPSLPNQTHQLQGYKDDEWKCEWSTGYCPGIPRAPCNMKDFPKTTTSLSSNLCFYISVSATGNLWKNVNKLVTLIYPLLQPSVHLTQEAGHFWGCMVCMLKYLFTSKDLFNKKNINFPL